VTAARHPVVVAVRPATFRPATRRVRQPSITDGCVRKGVASMYIGVGLVGLIVILLLLALVF
jgi:hypothetical protein